MGDPAEPADAAARRLSRRAGGRPLATRRADRSRRGSVDRSLRARADGVPAPASRVRGRAVSAIAFHRVWKSYPRWPSGTRTVRALVTRRVPLLGRSGRTWALSDVSFDVPAGGSLGLIGPNGAGKSTLLRLAAGLGRPTRGSVDRPDSTAAVLNFDSWFDGELTGRENAVTALVVNGWRRTQAKALLPAVLEFAELEDFADAPVRTYSEGMKLRLAFGVVAQLRPAALLIDEVIAVGDLRFQAKCMERIQDLRESGTTLLV